MSLFILASVIHNIITGKEKYIMNNASYVYSKSYIFKNIKNINKTELESIIKRINYYINNSHNYSFNNVKEYINSIIRIQYRLKNFNDIKCLKDLDDDDNKKIIIYNTNLLYNYAYKLYINKKTLACCCI